jgi:hypothetical protein
MVRLGRACFWHRASRAGKLRRRRGSIGRAALAGLLVRSGPQTLNGAVDTIMHFLGLFGSMAVSFVGFIGAAPMDLWFKIVVDSAALVWLSWLGSRVLNPESRSSALD